MTVALKLGTNGQLAAFTASDTLEIDDLDRLSGAGSMTIGASLGAAEELQLASVTSVVRVLGDFALDGAMDTDLDMGGNSLTGAATVEAANGGALRLWDTGDSNYLAFVAPALTANVTWTLPATDSTGTQYLRSDGAGNLSWGSPAGSGDVVGPGTHGDNLIARFNGIDTNTIQVGTNAPLYDDSGNLYADPSGSTQSPVAPRVIGFSTLAAGESVRFELGDAANGLQTGIGECVQLFSYHTLHLLGDRQDATAPAFVGGTAEDIAVLVDNITAGDIALVVRAHSTQTANLAEWQTDAGVELVAITGTGSITMGGTATSGDLNIPDEGSIFSYGGAAERRVAEVTGSALFIGENGAAAAAGAVAAVDIEATTNVDISLTASDTVVASFQTTSLLLYTDLDLNNNDIVDLKTATFEAEYAYAGGSTLDWNNGQKQGRTLTANTTITTFTAPTGGIGNYILRIKQAAAGGPYTITFPASVQWPGGTAPTMSTTASATDIFAFYYDGSTWHGVASQNFS